MITTKTGDKGKTTCDYQRVEKDSLLVEVVGTIDELQAILGITKLVFRSSVVDRRLEIEEVQKDLNQILGELAYQVEFKDLGNRLDSIEGEMEKIEKSLPEIKEFVIPGKNEAEAWLNLARTVCRRAERRVISLGKTKKVRSEILRYFNRLSDYLFLVSRVV